MKDARGTLLDCLRHLFRERIVAAGADAINVEHVAARHPGDSGADRLLGKSKIAQEPDQTANPDAATGVADVIPIEGDDHRLRTNGVHAVSTQTKNRFLAKHAGSSIDLQ
jgi:hypothetical protein